MIQNVPLPITTSKGSWLADHFANFVSKAIGRTIEPKLPAGYRRIFTPQEMSVIKNMWRSLKCASLTAGKPLLLPGRDVWIFSVLAHREGFDHVFRPDISRPTVEYVKEDYCNHFIFDTGFEGTIPRHLLKCRYSYSGTEARPYTMASSNKFQFDGGCDCDTCKKLHSIKNRKALIKEPFYQLFPRLLCSRDLALKIERTPKYWKRAESFDLGEEGKTWTNYSKRGYPTETYIIPDYVDRTTGIGQAMARHNEFLEAAWLTIEIFTDNSPKFSPKVSVSKSRTYYED